jgi:hypothetical protein
VSDIERDERWLYRRRRQAALGGLNLLEFETTYSAADAA